MAVRVKHSDRGSYTNEINTTGTTRETKMNSARWLSLIACTFPMLFVQGCSSLKTSGVDIVPIAQRTGELVAQVESGLEIPPPRLLIRYLDQEELPAVKTYTASWNELIDSLREIVRYSVVLIEIAEDPDAADSKELLAKNMESLYAGLLAQPSIGPELATVDIDAIVTQIRVEEKFIDSAKASQRAIDPAVFALESLVSRTGRSLDAAVEELLLAIDTYHADVVRFQVVIARRRNDAIRQLELLDIATQTGDQDAWNDFRSSNLYLQNRLENMDSSTPAAVDIAMAELMADLANLVALRESLDPDFELYLAEILELRDITQSIEGSLAIARLSVQTWEKGHQTFVDGKESRFWYYTSLLLSYAVEKAKQSVL
jgi:hypothetical protein